MGEDTIPLPNKSFFFCWMNKRMLFWTGGELHLPWESPLHCFSTSLIALFCITVIYILVLSSLQSCKYLEGKNYSSMPIIEYIFKRELLDLKKKQHFESQFNTLVNFTWTSRKKSKLNSCFRRIILLKYWDKIDHKI